MKEQERLALLGLWSVRGFGSVRLRKLQAVTPLADIAQLPCKKWLSTVPLPTEVAGAFPAHATLEEMGAQVAKQAERADMQVLFRGEEGFPGGLEVLADVPPVLFAWGDTAPVATPKVAMVGTRHPEADFLPTAHYFARRIAQAGALVVSGAADGVDQACLRAAMQATGKAWAFVGCALDCLGLSQRAFWKTCMQHGGAYFTEYPPGVQADRKTFPRRNRLISASADAVVVLRAPLRSGTLHTARYAREQWRPLWVLPGEVHNPNTEGCLLLLQQKEARLARSPDDIIAALALPLPPPETPPPPLGPLAEFEQAAAAGPLPQAFGRKDKRKYAPKYAQVGALPFGGGAVETPEQTAAALAALSEKARQVLALLDKESLFEELLAAAGMDSAGLSAALCELELSGRVAQKPGKRYARL